jgi:integrase
VPAEQSGSITGSGKRFGVRYRDAQGRQKRQSGFLTRREAQKWLSDRVEDVARERRGEAPKQRGEIPTFDQVCDELLASHTGEANTIRTLKNRLRSAREAFGDTRVDRITVPMVLTWRRSVPELSRWHETKCVRQVLHFAVAHGHVASNVATTFKNEEPKRREVAHLTPAEVELIANELTASRAALVIVMAYCGLRPEEAVAVERGDVDRERGIIRVNKVYTYGVLKPYTKTGKPRDVPLTTRVIEALDAMPARIDTRLLFPGDRGAHLSWHWFRGKVWKPALAAAGVAYRQPYALRHSYVSWSLAAGVPLREVAEHAGTSLSQIEATYGHVTAGAAERHAQALDSFTASAR